MRTVGVLLVSLALGGCTSAPGELDGADQRATAHPAEQREHHIVEQRFDGPGLVCGWAFALILRDDEQLTRSDPGLDFQTYAVTGNSDGFVLYEGNAPQPADDIVHIGNEFPNVVAIHDNRDDMAKQHSPIRNRLILGDDQQRLCGSEEPGN